MEAVAMQMVKTTVAMRGEGSTRIPSMNTLLMSLNRQPTRETTLISTIPQTQSILTIMTRVTSPILIQQRLRPPPPSPQQQQQRISLLAERRVQSPRSKRKGTGRDLLSSTRRKRRESLLKRAPTNLSLLLHTRLDLGLRRQTSLRTDRKEKKRDQRRGNDDRAIR